DMLVSGIAERRTLEDVFEFVRDDCELRIEPASRPDPFPNALSPPDPLDVVEPRLDLPASPDADESPLQDTTGPVSQDSRSKSSSNRSTRFIRVNAEKLDHLINL